MDSQQNLLVIAMFFMSFILWQAWQSDHYLRLDAKTINQIEKTISTDDTPNFNISSRKEKFITVVTDVLSLKINTRGGDIEEAFLLTYPDKLGSSKPFHLLETSPKFVYQAQSGLIGKNGPDSSKNSNRPIYISNHDTYTLDDGKKELRVDLKYTSPSGVLYIKTFTLKRGNFDINVDYKIDNASSKPIELTMFVQLKQTIDLPKTRDYNSNGFAFHAYRGTAYSTDHEKYKKYSFKDITSKNLQIQTNSGWIAMLQQYFATAWVPTAQSKNSLYTANLENGQVVIGFISRPLNILSGSQKILKAVLWLGPEIQDKMKIISPNLDLVVDYGYLWFISQPLFRLLKFIYGFVGNWGFSIIVITFIVRGIMYPLTKAQYTSMAKIRMLQPKLIAIRERLKHDKQRQSQEIMSLYKSEKVNPLGGCLPLLIQMPIFLALYYMLSDSIELRQAPFALWISDLSAQDPYYILPVLMGITMFFIQKMSPNNSVDPIQKKIMNFMPVIFSIFFLWFQSGLVLYYIISNMVTIFQLQLIYRWLEKRGLHSRNVINNK